jgi:hypothetical protein
MIAHERLGILRQRIESRPLGIDLCLQRQHVSQLRTTVFADIPEWEIADVHAMNDERAGDTQDIHCIVRAEVPGPR